VSLRRKDVTEDLTQLREALAESVSGNSGPLVAGALRAVPRHLFLPGVSPEQAYSDEAIVTKRDAGGMARSSSSQPALMAAMLDMLALAPGHRVLEIGAGTGYNAALIRHIVGRSGTMVSIDIDLDTVEDARANLAGAGFGDVTVLCRDGADGAPEYAPFDRLIATVGLSDLSPAWLAQLRPGARMVVPVDLRGSMLCVAFEREDGGHWASRAVEPCGFIKVRGALAGSSRDISLAEGLTLHLPGLAEVDAGLLARALAEGPGSMLATGIAAGSSRVTWTLYPWLCTGGWDACEISEELAAGRMPLLPGTPLRYRTAQFSYGLVSGGSVALLTVPAGEELAVAGYGSGGAALAAALADAVRAWDEAGRPGTEGLHVDAYPAGAPVPPAAGLDLVIDRPATRFTVYRA
jgi:protein-L-isoaspartate(D-aspartate) O-methyltransferase